MTLLDESSERVQTQLGASLKDSLDALDLNQEVWFTCYTRTVLPIGGFIYWQPVKRIGVRGALHYSQEFQQSADENVGLAQVFFTAQQKVTVFTAAPVNYIFVAEIDHFKVAFSSQSGFFRTADLWHYTGASLQPAFLTQLLDNPAQLPDVTQAVTSDSLTLWLALNSYVSPTYDGFGVQGLVPGFQLYPAYMVPTNLTAPYGAVDINPSTTQGLQAAPYLDQNRSHWQLCRESVRVTLYGLQNNQALDFLDAVLQYSVQTENFGIMNIPVPRDGQRGSPALQTLAMQKFIDFDISYYQQRVILVARQLIESVITTLYVGGKMATITAPAP